MLKFGNQAKRQLGRLQCLFVTLNRLHSTFYANSSLLYRFYVLSMVIKRVIPKTHLNSYSTDRSTSYVSHVFEWTYKTNRRQRGKMHRIEGKAIFLFSLSIYTYFRLLCKTFIPFDAFLLLFFSFYQLYTSAQHIHTHTILYIVYHFSCTKTPQSVLR